MSIKRTTKVKIKIESPSGDLEREVILDKDYSEGDLSIPVLILKEALSRSVSPDDYVFNAVNSTGCSLPLRSIVNDDGTWNQDYSETPYFDKKTLYVLYLYQKQNSIHIRKYMKHVLGVPEDEIEVNYANELGVWSEPTRAVMHGWRYTEDTGDYMLEEQGYGTRDDLTSPSLLYRSVLNIMRKFIEVESSLFEEDHTPAQIQTVADSFSSPHSSDYFNRPDPNILLRDSYVNGALDDPFTLSAERLGIYVPSDFDLDSPPLFETPEIEHEFIRMNSMSAIVRIFGFYKMYAGRIEIPLSDDVFQHMYDIKKYDNDIKQSKYFYKDSKDRAFLRTGFNLTEGDEGEISELYSFIEFMENYDSGTTPSYITYQGFTIPSFRPGSIYKSEFTINKRKFDLLLRYYIPDPSVPQDNLRSTESAPYTSDLRSEEITQAWEGLSNPSATTLADMCVESAIASQYHGDKTFLKLLTQTPGEVEEDLSEARTEASRRMIREGAIVVANEERDEMLGSEDRYKSDSGRAFTENSIAGMKLDSSATANVGAGFRTSGGQNDVSNPVGSITAITNLSQRQHAKPPSPKTHSPFKETFKELKDDIKDAVKIFKKAQKELDEYYESEDAKRIVPDINLEKEAKNLEDLLSHLTEVANAAKELEDNTSLEEMEFQIYMSESRKAGGKMQITKIRVMQSSKKNASSIFTITSDGNTKTRWPRKSSPPVELWVPSYSVGYLLNLDAIYYEYNRSRVVTSGCFSFLKPSVAVGLVQKYTIPMPFLQPNFGESDWPTFLGPVKSAAESAREDFMNYALALDKAVLGWGDQLKMGFDSKDPVPSWNKEFNKVCNLDKLYAKVLDKLNIGTILCQILKCMGLMPVSIPFDLKLVLPKIPKKPTFDFLGYITKIVYRALIRVLAQQLCKLVMTILDLLKLDCRGPDISLEDLPDYGPGNFDPGLRDLARSFANVGLPENLFEDSKSFINDLSTLLTPSELCNLFKGNQSNTVNQIAINLLSTAYRDNHGSTEASLHDFLGDTDRLSEFFAKLGMMGVSDFCETIEEAIAESGMDDDEDCRCPDGEKLRDKLCLSRDITGPACEAALAAAHQNRQRAREAWEDLANGRIIGDMVPDLVDFSNPSSPLFDLPDTMKYLLKSAIEGSLESTKFEYYNDIRMYVPFLHKISIETSADGQTTPGANKILARNSLESVETLRNFSYWLSVLRPSDNDLSKISKNSIYALYSMYAMMFPVYKERYVLVPESRDQPPRYLREDFQASDIRGTLEYMLETPIGPSSVDRVLELHPTPYPMTPVISGYIEAGKYETSSANYVSNKSIAFDYWNISNPPSAAPSRDLINGMISSLHATAEAAWARTGGRNAYMPPLAAPESIQVFNFFNPATSAFESISADQDFFRAPIIVGFNPPMVSCQHHREVAVGDGNLFRDVDSEIPPGMTKTYSVQDFLNGSLDKSDFLKAELVRLISEKLKSMVSDLSQTFSNLKTTSSSTQTTQRSVFLPKVRSLFQKERELLAESNPQGSISEVIDLAAASDIAANPTIKLFSPPELDDFVEFVAASNPITQDRLYNRIRTGEDYEEIPATDFDRLKASARIDLRWSFVESEPTAIATKLEVWHDPFFLRPTYDRNADSAKFVLESCKAIHPDDLPRLESYYTTVEEQGVSFPAGTPSSKKLYVGALIHESKDVYNKYTTPDYKLSLYYDEAPENSYLHSSYNKIIEAIFEETFDHIFDSPFIKDEGYISTIQKKLTGASHYQKSGEGDCAVENLQYSPVKILIDWERETEEALSKVIKQMRRPGAMDSIDFQKPSPFEEGLRDVLIFLLLKVMMYEFSLRAGPAMAAFKATDVLSHDYILEFATRWILDHEINNLKIFKQNPNLKENFKIVLMRTTGKDTPDDAIYSLLRDEISSVAERIDALFDSFIEDSQVAFLNRLPYGDVFSIASMNTYSYHYGNEGAPFEDPDQEFYSPVTMGSKKINLNSTDSSYMNSEYVSLSDVGDGSLVDSFGRRASDPSLDIEKKGGFLVETYVRLGGSIAKDMQKMFILFETLKEELQSLDAEFDFDEDEYFDDFERLSQERALERMRAQSGVELDFERANIPEDELQEEIVVSIQEFEAYLRGNILEPLLGSLSVELEELGYASDCNFKPLFAQGYPARYISIDRMHTVIDSRHLDLGHGLEPMVHNFVPYDYRPAVGAVTIGADLDARGDARGYPRDCFPQPVPAAQVGVDEDGEDFAQGEFDGDLGDTEVSETIWPPTSIGRNITRSTLPEDLEIREGAQYFGSVVPTLVKKNVEAYTPEGKVTSRVVGTNTIPIMEYGFSQGPDIEETRYYILPENLCPITNTPAKTTRVRDLTGQVLSEPNFDAIHLSAVHASDLERAHRLHPSVHNISAPFSPLNRSTGEKEISYRSGDGFAFAEVPRSRPEQVRAADEFPGEVILPGLGRIMNTPAAQRTDEFRMNQFNQSTPTTIVMSDRNTSTENDLTVIKNIEKNLKLVAPSPVGFSHTPEMVKQVQENLKLSTNYSGDNIINWKNPEKNYEVSHDEFAKHRTTQYGGRVDLPPYEVWTQYVVDIVGFAAPVFEVAETFHHPSDMPELTEDLQNILKIADGYQYWKGYLSAPDYDIANRSAAHFWRHDGIIAPQKQGAAMCDGLTVAPTIIGAAGIDDSEEWLLNRLNPQDHLQYLYSQNRERVNLLFRDGNYWDDMKDPYLEYGAPLGPFPADSNRQTWQRQQLAAKGQESTIEGVFQMLFRPSSDSCYTGFLNSSDRAHWFKKTTDNISSNIEYDQHAFFMSVFDKKQDGSVRMSRALGLIPDHLSLAGTNNDLRTAEESWFELRAYPSDIHINHKWTYRGRRAELQGASPDWLHRADQEYDLFRFADCHMFNSAIKTIYQDEKEIIRRQSELWSGIRSEDTHPYILGQYENRPDFTYGGTSNEENINERSIYKYPSGFKNKVAASVLYSDRTAYGSSSPWIPELETSVPSLTTDNYRGRSQSGKWNISAALWAQIGGYDEALADLGLDRLQNSPGIKENISGPFRIGQTLWAGSNLETSLDFGALQTYELARRYSTDGQSMDDDFDTMNWRFRNDNDVFLGGEPPGILPTDPFVGLNMDNMLGVSKLWDWHYQIGTQHQPLYYPNQKVMSSFNAQYATVQYNLPFAIATKGADSYNEGIQALADEAAVEASYMMQEASQEMLDLALWADNNSDIQDDVNGAGQSMYEECLADPDRDLSDCVREVLEDLPEQSMNTQRWFTYGDRGFHGMQPSSHFEQVFDQVAPQISSLYDPPKAERAVKHIVPIAYRRQGTVPYLPVERRGGIGTFDDRQIPLGNTPGGTWPHMSNYKSFTDAHPFFWNAFYRPHATSRNWIANHLRPNLSSRASVELESHLTYVKGLQRVQAYALKHRLPSLHFFQKNLQRNHYHSPNEVRVPIRAFITRIDYIGGHGNETPNAEGRPNTETRVYFSYDIPETLKGAKTRYNGETNKIEPVPDSSRKYFLQKGLEKTCYEFLDYARLERAPMQFPGSGNHTWGNQYFEKFAQTNKINWSSNIANERSWMGFYNSNPHMAERSIIQKYGPSSGFNPGPSQKAAKVFNPVDPLADFDSHYTGYGISDLGQSGWSLNQNINRNDPLATRGAFTSHILAASAYGIRIPAAADIGNSLWRARTHRSPTLCHLGLNYFKKVDEDRGRNDTWSSDPYQRYHPEWAFFDNFAFTEQFYEREDEGRDDLDGRRALVFQHQKLLDQVVHWFDATSAGRQGYSQENPLSWLYAEGNAGMHQEYIKVRSGLQSYPTYAYSQFLSGYMSNMFQNELMSYDSAPGFLDSLSDEFNAAPFGTEDSTTRSATKNTSQFREMVIANTGLVHRRQLWKPDGSWIKDTSYSTSAQAQASRAYYMVQGRAMLSMFGENTGPQQIDAGEWDSLLGDIKARLDEYQESQKDKVFFAYRPEDEGEWRHLVESNNPQAGFYKTLGALQQLVMRSFPHVTQLAEAADHDYDTDRYPLWEDQRVQGIFPQNWKRFEYISGQKWVWDSNSEDDGIHSFSGFFTREDIAFPSNRIDHWDAIESDLIERMGLFNRGITGLSNVLFLENRTKENAKYLPDCGFGPDIVTWTSVTHSNYESIYGASGGLGGKANKYYHNGSFWYSPFDSGWQTPSDRERLAVSQNDSDLHDYNLAHPMSKVYNARRMSTYVEPLMSFCGHSNLLNADMLRKQIAETSFEISDFESDPNNPGAQKDSAKILERTGGNWFAAQNEDKQRKLANACGIRRGFATVAKIYSIAAQEEVLYGRKVSSLFSDHQHAADHGWFNHEVPSDIENSSNWRDNNFTNDYKTSFSLEWDEINSQFASLPAVMLKEQIQLKSTIQEANNSTVIEPMTYLDRNRDYNHKGSFLKKTGLEGHSQRYQNYSEENSIHDNVRPGLSPVAPYMEKHKRDYNPVRPSGNYPSRTRLINSLFLNRAMWENLTSEARAKQSKLMRHALSSIMDKVLFGKDYYSVWSKMACPAYLSGETPSARYLENSIMFSRQSNTDYVPVESAQSLAGVQPNHSHAAGLPSVPSNTKGRVSLAHKQNLSKSMREFLYRSYTPPADTSLFDVPARFGDYALSNTQFENNGKLNTTSESSQGIPHSDTILKTPGPLVHRSFATLNKLLTDTSSQLPESARAAFAELVSAPLQEGSALCRIPRLLYGEDGLDPSEIHIGMRLVNLMNKDSTRDWFQAHMETNGADFNLLEQAHLTERSFYMLLKGNKYPNLHVPIATGETLYCFGLGQEAIERNIFSDEGTVQDNRFSDFATWCNSTPEERAQMNLQPGHIEQVFRDMMEVTQNFSKIVSNYELIKESTAYNMLTKYAFPFEDMKAAAAIYSAMATTSMPDMPSLLLPTKNAMLHALSAFDKKEMIGTLLERGSIVPSSADWSNYLKNVGTSGPIVPCGGMPSFDAEEMYKKIRDLLKQMPAAILTQLALILDPGYRSMHERFRSCTPPSQHIRSLDWNAVQGLTEYGYGIPVGELNMGTLDGNVPKGGKFADVLSTFPVDLFMGLTFIPVPPFVLPNQSFGMAFVKLANYIMGSLGVGAAFSGGVNSPCWSADVDADASQQLLDGKNGYGHPMFLFGPLALSINQIGLPWINPADDPAGQRILCTRQDELNKVDPQPFSRESQMGSTCEPDEE